MLRKTKTYSDPSCLPYHAPLVSGGLGGGGIQFTFDIHCSLETFIHWKIILNQIASGNDWSAFRALTSHLIALNLGYAEVKGNY